ncbi:chlororespiratory reduction protein 7 [Anthocerotibacter panamensis]|uniref:chlororespiratory reduction protein 7 n=1 Tax=Anthocerotibacter panamensis TaxID=2857077 RepID=UPI001C4080FD|nr:chlororespiratory reduction protein 7 [Anthocerotibacter panamensis]
MTMTDMDDEQYYVVLETDKDEQFLPESQLRAFLGEVLCREQGVTPEALEQAVTELLDTACEIPLGPGRYCQWYATRIDRPSSRKRDW